MPLHPAAALRAMATCLVLQATILAAGNLLLSLAEGPDRGLRSAVNHSLK
ncbi:MAG: hypothetical protein VKM01_07085 [Cyanobacteriota bacterium]|nr:hypothetical protein [Cyanobacteriota bacterium]